MGYLRIYWKRTENKILVITQSVFTFYLVFNKVITRLGVRFVQIRFFFRTTAASGVQALGRLTILNLY